MYNCNLRQTTAKHPSSGMQALMQAANVHLPTRAPSKPIVRVIAVLICILKIYPKDKKETVLWSLCCKLPQAQPSGSWLLACWPPSPPPSLLRESLATPRIGVQLYHATRPTQHIKLNVLEDQFSLNFFSSTIRQCYLNIGEPPGTHGTCRPVLLVLNL